MTLGGYVVLEDGKHRLTPKGAEVGGIVEEATGREVVEQIHRGSMLPAEVGKDAAEFDPFILCRRSVLRHPAPGTGYSALGTRCPALRTRNFTGALGRIVDHR